MSEPKVWEIYRPNDDVSPDQVFSGPSLERDSYVEVVEKAVFDRARRLLLLIDQLDYCEAIPTYLAEDIDDALDDWLGDDRPRPEHLGRPMPGDQNTIDERLKELGRREPNA